MTVTVVNPVTGKAEEITDLYPPSLLENMRTNPSRERTSQFIRTYYAFVKQNSHLPNHWHHFAAEILFNAQSALNANYKTHKGPLANAMWLQGEKGNVTRDTAIALTIQQKLNKMEDSSRYGAIKAAKASVHTELEGTEYPVSMSVIDEAWKNRDKKGVKDWAKATPDFPYLSLP